METKFYEVAAFRRNPLPNNPTLGTVSGRSRKVFAPGNPQENVELYDYRAVLFTKF